MKTVLVFFVWLALAYARAAAADLYLVTLHSSDDADRLRGIVLPVLRDGNEYLVLADSANPVALKQRGLDHSLLAAGVSLNELAIDRRRNLAGVEQYPVLYTRGELRLLRVPPANLRSGEAAMNLMAIPNRHLRIAYVEPQRAPLPTAVELAPYDSLVQRVQQDSVTAYLLRLQAFRGRVAGTDSNRAASNWIKNKFQEFGYDSVYKAPFGANVAGGFTTCYNVVAMKQGTTYPDVQIVVGAHFDGVVGSPAADDNGTGTVGVLEMARALSTVQTAVTLVFVTFDAEEYGLYGSWDYADRAAQDGDRILFMWNMDMIGQITNSGQAKLYQGASTRVAQTFMAVAPQYGGIVGSLAGSSAQSDHFPFLQDGFEAVFLQEYNFSTVYHTYRDSTRFINFDYATRMIKSSLATVITLSESNDLDGDGVPNAADNCVTVVNASQADLDADLYGDACDNCPSTYNPAQSDIDGDRQGDFCDACPLDITNDQDGDGHCENVDNCPGVWNPGQENTDGNGQGDACQFTAPSYTITGAAAQDSLGYRVSSAGDVNNDGYDDVLAGAPGSGSGNEGEAFLFSGKDGTRLIQLTGEAASDQFGSSVAIIPDLNGDGFAEMLVGAPRNSAVDFYSGRAYLFLGHDGPFPEVRSASAAHHVFSGTSLAQFLGTSVCATGDVDGDGVSDLAISAAQVQGIIGPGEVGVYSGATFSMLYTVYGENIGDWFGYDIDAVEDVNDDAIPDLIVGAPKHFANAADCGRAYLHSGADGALLATFTGEAVYEQFGFSVAGLGDLNGDGSGDVVIGAPYDGTFDTWSGRAYVFSARDSALLYTYYGHSYVEGTGLSVSGAGDVNGDGTRDFLISSFQRYATHFGKVELYSGATGAILHTFLGDEPSGGFGIDVSGLGDLNGDGVADLVVGAFARDGAVADAGAVYVFILGDPDSDGIADSWDNCPSVYNPDQADVDADGHGNVCDNCRYIANPDQQITIALTGDVNQSGTITSEDLIALVNYVFKLGAAPEPCPVAGDANCSGHVSAADIITLVNHVFKGGTPPCDVCEAGPGTWSCP